MYNMHPYFWIGKLKKIKCLLAAFFEINRVQVVGGNIMWYEMCVKIRQAELALIVTGSIL
jgi:hypothetical protein